MIFHMATEPTRRRILGGAVRQLRIAKQIKQDELATACEMHFSYLSKVETGKRQPSTEAMLRIAQALGVGLDDISYVTPVYILDDNGVAA
jgi:transcriptional regulator with XRE-family HTH domain